MNTSEMDEFRPPKDAFRELEKREFHNRCMEVGICPDCGRELIYREEGKTISGDEQTVLRLYCDSCNKQIKYYDLFRVETQARGRR